MNISVAEIALRLKTLREILEISVEDMASKLGVSENTYIDYENGNQDFSVTFLQKCADIMNVDITDLLTGENPKLSFYSVTRNGHGINMSRREGFSYQHLAHNLKGKLAEPFMVIAPYSEKEQNQPIPLSTHNGQEFDYILKGSLKVQIENHTVTLTEGDAIMYDSSYEHGMIAVGGSDCEFIALVIK